MWDPRQGFLESSVFEGVDAVINLNGANIAGRRWSPEYKEKLRSSRLQATTLLAETLGGMSSPPKVLISASATGFYGDRGDERLDESSAPGKGFLADLSREWEEANSPAARAGIRVVVLRLPWSSDREGRSTVCCCLSRWEWAVLLATVGSGGRGSRLMTLSVLLPSVLDQEAVAGPINLASPEEATSRTFAQALVECCIVRPSFRRRRSPFDCWPVKWRMPFCFQARESGPKGFSGWGISSFLPRSTRHFLVRSKAADRDDQAVADFDDAIGPFSQGGVVSDDDQGTALFQRSCSRDKTSVPDPVSRFAGRFIG